MASETSLAARMEKLTDIVERLESPDISLENAVKLYKEGQKLVGLCRSQLEKARNTITVLAEDGTEQPLKPLDDELEDKFF